MSMQDPLTEQEDRLAEQEDRLAEQDRLVEGNRFTKKDYPAEFLHPPRREPVWGPDKPWKTKESYENAVQVAMAEKQRRLAQPS